MACSTCCFAWGKMAIANNYIAKGCCKFLCHTDLCLLWKCRTGWIRLKNGSVEEAGLKGEFPLSPPQLLCELIELPDSVPFCVLMMGFFLFMNWGEGCETCTALGSYPFLVVHGKSLGKSCRILLTKDVANIPSGFCMEHSAMPLSPLPRSPSIFHGERYQNRREAPLSLITMTLPRERFKQIKWDIFF